MNGLRRASVLFLYVIKNKKIKNPILLHINVLFLGAVGLESSFVTTKPFRCEEKEVYGHWYLGTPDGRPPH